MKKICALCGKEFESNYKRAMFCKEEHWFDCAYCGKRFKIDKDLQYAKKRLDAGMLCCSKKCAINLQRSKMSEDQLIEDSKRRRESAKKYLDAHSKERDEKTRKTKLERYGDATYNNRDKASKTCCERYGVDNAAKSKESIEKTKRVKSAKYGDESYNNREKALSTFQSRYGVDNPMHVETFKNKMQKTNLERYGCISSFGGKDVQEKSKESLLNRYGVDNASKLPDHLVKSTSTMVEKYGDIYVHTDEYKERRRKTCLRDYGVDNPAKSDEVKQKAKDTSLKRYGVDAPAKSDIVKKRAIGTSIERYGVPYPMQSASVRSKAVKSARASKLEVRLAALLDEYKISYETQHIVQNKNSVHAFDFYIPEYKILLDANGIYYHSYLSDPDGKHVRDDYDDVRISLIPKDHVFILAIENQEEKAIKEVVDAIKSIDSDAFDYDSDLFKWCRSIGFPYPSYDEKRMLNDWGHLCEYEFDSYKSTCRIGISVIKNFHKSIYDAHVGNNVSTREAWDDDGKLKKVIANRLIYKNDVEPCKGACRVQHQ